MIDEQQYNEKKNEDEDDNNSESSYDSQKTAEVNFKGIDKEEVNVKNVLTTLIHQENIDKYIGTLIQNDNDQKNNGIQQKKTLKLNPEEEKRKIEEQAKNILLNEMKNMTLPPDSLIKNNDEEKYKEIRRKQHARSSWKHLTDIGFRKNIQLILQKEQCIKINKEKVTQYYSVLEDLGHGAFGSVKKVLDKQLNEYRAMKIFNTLLYSKILYSSNNGIEILRKISHPHIVNIFEIFEEKNII